MRPHLIAFCATPHRQLVPADFPPGPYLNTFPGLRAVQRIRIERIPSLR